MIWAVEMLDSLVMNITEQALNDTFIFKINIFKDVVAFYNFI